MKHRPFITHYGNLPCMFIDTNMGEALFINRVTVVTKAEAMRFFNLVDEPEPKKPAHAGLIKAFAEGAVIQCHYTDWEPDVWIVLHTHKDMMEAFLSHKVSPEWTFRIKPE